MMNRSPESDRWRQVEQLFHQLVEQEGSDALLRQQLTELAGGDRELEAEVWELLAAARKSGQFLEQPGVLQTGLDPAAWSELLGHWSHHSRPSNGGPIGTGPLTGNGDPQWTVVDVHGIPDHSGDRNVAAELAGAITQYRPDYRIVGVAGQGGAGFVFRAEDQRLGRNVAIKVLHGSRDARRQLLELEREARSAAVASDHLVVVYEVSPVDAPLPFLVMEWINGPTLREWLHREGLPPVMDAARIAWQIAEGVAAAHRRGLVHGDIKPANVMMEPVPASGTKRGEWRAKVTDFGLATVAGLGDGGEKTGRFTGTPAYAAPERLLHRRPLTVACDVWSIGATLYQLLLGTPPWSGAPHAIARQMESGDPVPPRRRDAGIPGDLESVCLKALARNPAQRYPDAQAMAEDLARFLQGEPVEALPVTTWRRVRHWIARNPSVSALGALAAMLVVALLAGSLFTAWTVTSKNREILNQLEATRLARLEKIIGGEPSGLLTVDDAGEFDHPPERELLRSRRDNPQTSRRERINAAILLAGLGEPDWPMLCDAVATAPASVDLCTVLVEACRAGGDPAREVLRQEFDSRERGQWRVALMLAMLGDPEFLNRICGESADPAGRTELIHGLAGFHSLPELLDLIRPDGNPAVVSALCAGLSFLDRDRLAKKDVDRIVATLGQIRLKAPAGGSFVAAGTALHRMGLSQTEKTEESARAAATRCINGVQLVPVPAGESTLGRLHGTALFEDHPSHRVQITRPFLMSWSEIDVAAYKRFLADAATREGLLPSGYQWAGHDSFVSPDTNFPVQQVSWHDAALFCNWMSDCSGRRARYRFEVANPDESDGPQGSRWGVAIDRAADGFRLPTEAEWEHACRAGTQTDYFFGDDIRLLPWYGAWSSARRIPALPPEQLLPNPWGLVAMHGNVWEWCEDWWSPLGPEPLVDPRGPETPVPARPHRVYRGGGVATMSGESGSGDRGSGLPHLRYSNLGFRIVVDQ